jgi:hypothetical protein
VPLWHPPADQTYENKFKRGFIASTAAMLATEPLHHICMNAKLLSQFYVWPKTRQETNIFAKEVFKIPDFWPEMRKKVTFGAVAAFGDVGLKLTAWHHVYGGTWSPQDLPDYNSLKTACCAFISMLPVCWTGLPFMNAKRAYYADKSWPVELRRNYKSPLNALARIPFEEGTSYLFKGAWPVCMHNLTLYTTFLTYYAWMKNKGHPFWLYMDYNYTYIKTIFFAIGWTASSFIAYPFMAGREMVDLWPKERGGHCTWGNNYRQNTRWMILNIEYLMTNFMAGYWTWMRR